MFDHLSSSGQVEGLNQASFMSPIVQCSSGLTSSPMPNEAFCQGAGIAGQQSKRVAFQVDQQARCSPVDITTHSFNCNEKKIKQRVKIKSSQEIQGDETKKLAVSRI